MMRKKLIIFNTVLCMVLCVLICIGVDLKNTRLKQQGKDKFSGETTVDETLTDTHVLVSTGSPSETQIETSLEISTTPYPTELPTTPLTVAPTTTPTGVPTTTPTEAPTVLPTTQLGVQGENENGNVGGMGELD